MKPFIYLAPLLLLAACNKANPPIITSGFCAIDQPIANATLSAAQNINMGGWAYDKQTGTSPEHVRIQFTSTDRQVSKTFDAKRGTKRPDVVKAFNAPGAEMSGFDLVVPANSLVPGKYEIVILQDLPNVTLFCGNGQVLQVK